MTRKHRTARFTLIELLVVIGIIGILSGVVLVALNNTRSKGRIANGQQFARLVDTLEGDQATAYYDFDDCATATDTSGNGKNATSFTGTVTWSTDTPTGSGCSVSFNNSHITLPNISVANHINTPFTLSLWVKVPALQTAMGFVSSADYNQGGYLIGESNGATAGQPAFVINYPGVQCSMGGNTLLNTNEWTNLVGVYDGSTMYLYMDSKLIGTSGCSQVGTNPHIFQIGQGTQGGWTGSFVGSIDSVHFYSKSLTAMDVRKNYLAERERFLAKK